MGLRCRDEVADRLAPPMGDEPLRRLLDRALVDDELDEAARGLRSEGLDDPVRHSVQVDRVLVETLFAATVLPASQISNLVRVARDEAEELAHLRSSYPSLVRADNGRHFLAEVAEVNVDPGVQA